MSNPTWNAAQYLQFVDERTRPCRELAGRVAVKSPINVIDLGCGPGNSTDVLASRWPYANLVGQDSSPEMLDAARAAHPERRYIQSDIATWEKDQPYDVIFSNAAMQWVPDHHIQVPRLFQQVSPGGAFAMQVPANFDAPPHRLMRELAASSRWKHVLPANGVREWHVHDLPHYYDLLSPLAERLDLWVTEYMQVLDDVQGVVDWYKGAGLRPFLDALPTDDDRRQFEIDYLAALKPEFPAHTDGKVLFPFRRMFIIAYARS